MLKFLLACEKERFLVWRKVYNIPKYDHVSHTAAATLSSATP